jgi:hypothetical protein
MSLPYELYYSTKLDKEYTSYQLLQLFNIDTNNYTDPESLIGKGFYPVVQTSYTFDSGLYDPVLSHVIVGLEAVQTWTPVARPLSDAKTNASESQKVTFNTQSQVLVANSGVSLDIWAGAASQDPGDRPPVYNTLLGEMASIGDTLAANLAAIDSATTVDEINNIVNPPSGILNTGRGSGLGPEDLNPSYFVELNSISLTPADMELYVPGTTTVIPYDSFLPPPYTFDSLGDCFNPGDYVIQIRVAATSEVVAEFEVPLNPLNEDVSF